MKRIMAIILMSMFMLGVPIIDGQEARENGNAGGDRDNDRSTPPKNERPRDSQQEPTKGEGAVN